MIVQEDERDGIGKDCHLKDLPRMDDTGCYAPYRNLMLEHGPVFTVKADHEEYFPVQRVEIGRDMPIEIIDIF